MGRFATGQEYTPYGATASGPNTFAPNGFTPNTVFQPQNTFQAPPPAYGPQSSFSNGILPTQGYQEPGALNNLNYNQPLGDVGNVSLSGSPDPGGYSMGAGFSLNPNAGGLYIRDLQAAVYTNQEQTVVNAGTTFTLYSNDYFGIGGRALLGGTVDDDVQDELHFSGDAFAGVRLPGEIWLKGGFLYDTQDNFYKIGPSAGLVLMADAKHPVTVDFAYGFGAGNVRENQSHTGILAVADDDIQLRVGTFVSPMLQVGMSGNWSRWDDEQFTDDQGIGGFARINIADLQLTVDVTEGDLGTRGFVNVAYVFGGPHRRSWRQPSDGSGFVDQPRDWLTRPVMRDTSLRVQQVIARQDGGGQLPNPPIPPPIPVVVGNLTQVLCQIQLDPSMDEVNDGVLDPGDGFNLLVTLGNGTTVTATNVVTTNLTANVPFVVFNTPSSEVIAFGDITAGTQVTNNASSALLGIDPSAMENSVFALDFDVVSDGQTRRFRCAPITLSQTGNNSPATNAIPLGPATP